MSEESDLDVLLTLIPERLERLENLADKLSRQTFVSEYMNVFSSLLLETIKSFKETVTHDIDLARSPGIEALIDTVILKLRHENLTISLLFDMLQNISTAEHGVIHEIYYFLRDFLRYFEKEDVIFPFLIMVRSNYLAIPFSQTLKDWFADYIEPSLLEKMARFHLYVIVLPLEHTNNPFAWTLLLHEAAHSVNDRLNLTERILEPREAPLEYYIPSVQVAALPIPVARRKWTNELVVDLLALFYIGPVYISNLRSFLIRGRSDFLEETHSPPEQRIASLARELYNIGQEFNIQELIFIKKMADDTFEAWKETKEDSLITPADLLNKIRAETREVATEYGIHLRRLIPYLQELKNTEGLNVQSLVDNYISNQIPVAADPAMILNVAFYCRDQIAQRTGSEKFNQVLTECIKMHYIKSRWRK